MLVRSCQKSSHSLSARLNALFSVLSPFRAQWAATRRSPGRSLSHLLEYEVRELHWSRQAFVLLPPCASSCSSRQHQHDATTAGSTTATERLELDSPWRRHRCNS
ncbi:hypothetical protein C8F01DRAFT_1369539 [Mycena amicta]|nr:hypothetical protein C8F01DRAFT_1369539 [Mycena amicta]